MRDDLLLYYERELTFLRQMGAEFAEKYPKIASRLLLEPDKCDDPHVERMLEAFAFLAARVHLKIDDEFPELTDALLSIVYPQFVRTIPSMSICEFHVDQDQAKQTVGLAVKRGSILSSRPVQGTPCKFRTGYDLTVWPISVANAEWRTPDRLNLGRGTDAVGGIRLELESPEDVPLSSLPVESLRFYIAGESATVHTIYELLCSRCSRLVVRDPRPGSKIEPVVIQNAIRPLGFEPDEGLLPYPRRSLSAYRLLQEYFSFPEKFFFFDVQLPAVFARGFHNKAELIFPISPFERNERKESLEVSINAKTFRLNCTPVVNLFELTSEPILLDQQRYEYPVVPDVRRPLAVEIFSIDQVVGLNALTQESADYQPFYSFRHSASAEKRQTFYLAHRRPSQRANDEGMEFSLSLVDLSLRPMRPESDTITLKLTCTNRDLPARLPFGSENGDFELEGGGVFKKILCLRKPTAPFRPMGGKGIFWRLISHLSLNHLSLVEDGLEALQEILKLYDFSNSSFSQKQVEQGLVKVASRPHFARLITSEGIAFARGTRVELELDEEQFTGGGVYLFGAVLERFLGGYAALNSFSQLALRTSQRKEVLREWPPRAGDRILL